MPEIYNADRADWARQALEVHINATKFSPGDRDINDPTAAECGLGDLLGDLRHLADTLGIDYDAANLQGGEHYTAEVAEEEADEHEQATDDIIFVSVVPPMDRS